MRPALSQYFDAAVIDPVHDPNFVCQGIAGTLGLKSAVLHAAGLIG